jgi:G3E family GTPase
MIGEDRMYTITLIDAFRAMKLYNEAQQFFTRQVEGSDIVAVNKVDLVSEKTREDVAELISSISPNSEIAFISAKTGEGVPHLTSILGGMT